MLEPKPIPVLIKGEMAAGILSSLLRLLSCVVVAVVDVVSSVVKPFLAICDARCRPQRRPEPCRRPVSVNYHFLRTCNYSCGFCFHTAKTSYVLPIEEVSGKHPD